MSNLLVNCFLYKWYNGKGTLDSIVIISFDMMALKCPKYKKIGKCFQIRNWKFAKFLKIWGNPEKCCKGLKMPWIPKKGWKICSLFTSMLVRKCSNSPRAVLIFANINFCSAVSELNSLNRARIYLWILQVMTKLWK